MGGDADGYVNAQIRPRGSGYVMRQAYEEGSVVRKGDLLFEIDHRPFKAALDQAEAEAGLARAKFVKASQDVMRDAPLAKERAIARGQLETDIEAKLGAQAMVNSAKANAGQARLNLEFTKVTSRVTGVAGIARVQIGNVVGPTSILTSVSQVDPIKAYFTISEQEFTNFQPLYPTERSAQEQRKRIPLELILSDGGVYERPGMIRFEDPEVNPAAGAIRIASVFPNPENSVPASSGEFAPP